MTTANEGAGTKMVDIMTRSVSTATERDIVERGTGRGSTGIGSKSCMGTGIERGSGMAIEIKSGTCHDEMIGAETIVAVVVEVVLVHALRGSMRNPDGRMIDAASSGAMVIIVVTIEGAKRAHLLAEVVVAVAVEHGKMLVVPHQRGGH